MFDAFLLRGDSSSIGNGPFFLVKMWKWGLEYNCIVVGHWVPILMVYSILNKLDFENMAFFFSYLSVPAQSNKKNEILFKFMKNIGYTQLNLSIFPYTRLYTSHKRFRNFIKNAFLIQKKNKKVIFCQTPTKAAMNFFKQCIVLWIVLYVQNKCVPQVW